MTMYVTLKKQKYSFKAMFIIGCLLLLIAFEMAGGRNYFDEVLGIVSIMYVIWCMGLKKIEKTDSLSIFMLLVVIILGVVSNIFSGITVSGFSIIIDIIAETKFLWVFFAAKYYIDSQTVKDVCRILKPIAILFCVVAGVLAIVSQMVDLGMSTSVRYGIKGFRFFFPMSFQFLAVAIVAIGILVLNEKRIMQRKIVVFACCVGLLMTTKSSPIFFVVIFFVLSYYFRKKEKLRISTIVFLSLIVVLLGKYQIETYLMNEDAPRHLFFYYGGVTANEYFPLGSGFATFGSDQAARNYSELYYRYGFDSLFGMNPDDGSFLSDTFWPMALGQFGWFGAILYIGVYFRVFLSFSKYKLSATQKAFVYAVYLSHIIHAIGSAILSSASGIIGVIGLVLVLANGKTYQQKVDTHRVPSIVLGE